MKREEKIDEIFKNTIRKQDEYRGVLIQIICIVGIFGMFCSGV